MNTIHCFVVMIAMVRLGGILGQGADLAANMPAASGAGAAIAIVRDDAGVRITFTGS